MYLIQNPSENLDKLIELDLRDYAKTRKANSLVMALCQRLPECHNLETLILDKIGIRQVSYYHEVLGKNLILLFVDSIKLMKTKP